MHTYSIDKHIILQSTTINITSTHIITSSPYQTYIICTSFTITKYHMIHIVMHTSSHNWHN